MNRNSKRLIVNADDFGLHPLVNAGIIEGHRRGCISSTSLMPGGAAFAEAVSLAKETPTLGIGVHLTLVGGEQTVCPFGEVASLVNQQGRLLENYGLFLQRFFTGKIRLSEVERELAAQIEKAVNTGIPITHVDSHQHLHVLPKIRDIVIDLAKQYKISAVRIPAEPYFFFGGFPWSMGRFIGRGGLTYLAQQARGKFCAAGFRHPDHFYGMLAGGNMFPNYFLQIIRQLPAGSSEIMIHPGMENQPLDRQYPWRYHWQDELAAVLQPAVQEELQQGIQLITFKELIHE